MRYAIITLLLLLPFLSNAQKIARYTTGAQGTDDYFEMSFWSDKKIVYKKGIDTKEYNVQFLGVTFYQNEKALMLQLADNTTLRVLPLEDGRLSMSGMTSNYYKMLKWIHDGPKNQKGLCLPCTVDEKEAYTLLKKTYM
jgi:hypothetical protein